MASAAFCVILLIAVINVWNMAQTDRNMKNALKEMTATTRFWGGLNDTEIHTDKIPGGDGRLPGNISGTPWWAPGKEEGMVPDRQEAFFPEGDDRGRDIRDSAMSRYAGRFSVVTFLDDEMENVRMSDGNALSEDDAAELAEEILKTGKTEGRLNDYYFLVTEERITENREEADRSDDSDELDDSKNSNESDDPENTDKSEESGDSDDTVSLRTIVAILDGSAERDNKNEVLLITSLSGLGGLLVMGFFVYLMSKRAMAPLKESTEKQKRFITDAGHELKTPLSVISTNMDILEQDIGKNEWVDGTRKQVGRLRKLVTSLVSLSKLEEMQEAPEMERICISEAVEECADAFTGAAEMAGKELIPEIEPDLYVEADMMKLSQLMTILCDNAVKYAKGDITVRLYSKKTGFGSTRSGSTRPGSARSGSTGKGTVIFETENDWDHTLSPSELNKLFDRFYRADESRSKKDGKEGYGLGLSIAKAIADQMKANLTVEETKEGMLKFVVSMKSA